jgi:hypothetical protein
MAATHQTFRANHSHASAPAANPPALLTWNAQMIQTQDLVTHANVAQGDQKSVANLSAAKLSMDVLATLAQQDMTALTLKPLTLGTTAAGAQGIGPTGDAQASVACDFLVTMQRACAELLVTAHGSVKVL